MQILAVVVRYKTPLDQSQTILSLCQAFHDAPELAQTIEVFIWDNTSEPLYQPHLPIPFQYQHTGENLGVSGAYNQAIEVAAAHGCPWMLLLDQDTSLNAFFLERILAYSYEMEGDPEICSVVPFVRSHGELVSPRRLKRLNRVPQIERGFSGVLRTRAYAINSASLMRLSALREIGGYSEEFWLDLSDVHAFESLYRRKKFIYVANDLELDHSIAGMNFEQDMVPERYKTFLAAENLYLERYRSRFENIFQAFRLFARTLRQYVEYKDKAYAAITWRYFLSKLFTPKTLRLQQWREYLLNKRKIPSTSDRQSRAGTQNVFEA
jgi:GT2 family glycosyltransferase